jgi:hypothetical protein
MHFSSMAVSVLAQSVPLLAVRHLDGWKKRELRSWWQSRRLRDAVLVGINDKHGTSFKKRVGVFDKQDNVLEKKHAGFSHLEQNSASSEVPSDFGEGSVECNPLSKVTNSGIIGCGIDSHCVDSEKSNLGGFCVALKQASSINNRALQQDVSCVAGPNEDGVTCDCSQFNSTSGLGTKTCTYPEEPCPDDARELCDIERSYTMSPDGSYGSGYCFDPTSGSELVDNFCYSTSFTAEGYAKACEAKVNGVLCNSCAFEVENCPANSEQQVGTVLNCTNTVINKQGNTCNKLLGFLSSLDETEAPSASPVEETGMPTSGTFESMMPTAATEPTNNSGGSLTAKMTIVVSAAVTAWLASFGI